MITPGLGVAAGLLGIKTVTTMRSPAVKSHDNCLWAGEKTASKGDERGANSGHPVRLNRRPETPQVLADSNTVEIEASIIVLWIVVANREIADISGHETTAILGDDAKSLAGSVSNYGFF
jgi:hypothetical protein